MRVPQSSRSGSRAFERHLPGDVEREWREARSVDQAEMDATARPSLPGAVALLVAASGAAVVSSALPFSPGYASRDIAAAVVAAVIAAIAAIAAVPIAAAAFGRTARRHGSVILYGCGLLSAGAAAIHFAVLKMHFEEYTLFGVFFVLSGLAQLGWAILVVASPRRWLLQLGAAGNAAIAALWAVDRIWGLPLGPEHWKPDPVGFGDVAASAFEILIAAGCIVAIRRGLSARPPQPVSRRAVSLAVLVAAVTALGLLSTLGIGAPLITPST
jgi:hypothetical protein